MGLWHDGLGQAANSTIKTIVAEDFVKGTDLNDSVTHIDCIDCCEGNYERDLSKERSTRCAKLEGSYIPIKWDPPMESTVGDKTCMASFIDEKSRTVKYQSWKRSWKLWKLLRYSRRVSSYQMGRK